MALTQDDPLAQLQALAVPEQQQEGPMNNVLMQLAKVLKMPGMSDQEYQGMRKNERDRKNLEETRRAIKNNLIRQGMPKEKAEEAANARVNPYLRGMGVEPGPRTGGAQGPPADVKPQYQKGEERRSYKEGPVKEVPVRRGAPKTTEQEMETVQEQMTPKQEIAPNYQEMLQGIPPEVLQEYLKKQLGY